MIKEVGWATSGSNNLINVTLQSSYKHIGSLMITSVTSQSTFSGWKLLHSPFSAIYYLSAQESMWKSNDSKKESQVSCSWGIWPRSWYLAVCNSDFCRTWLLIAKRRRGFKLVSILFDSAPSQWLIGDFKIAVESMGQCTVPWPLLLKFESSSPDDVALRLEDILDLMFRAEQEKFKIDIFNCQKVTRGGLYDVKYHLVCLYIWRV